MNIKQIVKLDEIDQRQSIYTDKNHISNKSEILKQGFDFGEVIKHMNDLHVTHQVTNWDDNEIVEFEGGWWMPKTEFYLMNQEKEMLKKNGGNWEFDFGYINGRMSYLGPLSTGGMTSASMLPGYGFWMTFKNTK